MGISNQSEERSDVEKEKSGLPQVEFKKGKARDAFPGESYQKSEPKGNEYSHPIDDKPNELSDGKRKDEYDAVDPSEIPEKKKKEKKQKLKDEDFIDFEDEHEVKKDKKEDEEEDDSDDEEKEDDDSEDSKGSGNGDSDSDNEFDDELIERALDAGMNEDDILDFDNKKELRRYVRALEISNNKKSRDQNADEEIPAKKKSDENTGELKIEEFKLELDKDVYEPKVVEAIENLNKHYHKQLVDIAKKNSELESKLKKREQDEILKENRERELSTVREFDSVLKKLTVDKENGEFWKKEFGESDAFTIKKDTREFKKRSAIYAEFLAFLEVDRAKGRNSSIESLIKKAINSKYEGHAVNIAKNKLSEQLKKRTKLFTERANSKDPGNSGLTPKQIAIKNAKEKIERKRSGE